MTDLTMYDDKQQARLVLQNNDLQQAFHDSEDWEAFLAIMCHAVKVSRGCITILLNKFTTS